MNIFWEYCQIQTFRFFLIFVLFFQINLILITVFLWVSFHFFKQKHQLVLFQNYFCKIFVVFFSFFQNITIYSCLLFSIFFCIFFYLFLYKMCWTSNYYLEYFWIFVISDTFILVFVDFFYFCFLSNMSIYLKKRTYPNQYFQREVWKS